MRLRPLAGHGSTSRPRAPPLRHEPAPAPAAATRSRPGRSADPAAKSVRTHGRVFFKIPGVGLASCSGTAISSNRRNLVLTAGHCVNGGGHQGRWYTHWVFVPGYSHGTAPFGAWRAKRLYSTPIWVEFRDPTGDIGFATVAARKGTRLQDAVGASGISFGRGVRRRYQAFGYPANPKDGFDGESERYCNSRLRTRDRPARHVLGPKTVGISCDMTEGASGGSWMAKQGYAVSLSSYYYPQLHDALFGPYFGSLAHELYEGTQTRCDGRAATIIGTGKADRLRGTPGRDVIVGGAGGRPDHRTRQARHRLRRRRCRPDHRRGRSRPADRRGRQRPPPWRLGPGLVRGRRGPQPWRRLRAPSRPARLNEAIPAFTGRQRAFLRGWCMF